MHKLVRTTWLAAGIAILALAGGCSRKNERPEISAPEVMYERAHNSLISGDYRNAVRMYEALEGRYPFSLQARQGKLDLMYAYYKTREAESAVDAADQFVRENPTHPRIDYTWYIKGLVYFERTPNIIERWFKTDLTERPPQDARRSFQAFETLIRQYPNSAYVHDSRQRMMYLRNRLADYEANVADYYLRRGAYVAAINRAKFCIENYDGAPAVQRAVGQLVEAYASLGLDDLAEQSRQVYALNYSDAPPRAGDSKRSWWKFW